MIFFTIICLFLVLLLDVCVPECYRQLSFWINDKNVEIIRGIIYIALKIPTTLHQNRFNNINSFTTVHC